MSNHVVGPPLRWNKIIDPRSLITTLNWRDFIDCIWKDTNFNRRAIASLIQAVYFLELDRQKNRTKENSLAPDFWIPFKHKRTQILFDERDGSIFGAIFEWDRSAALSEFKPVGVPRAVLALRGTLVRFPTMRRDFEDNFRFLAWESLMDSVRFKVAMDAVKSVYDTYGSRYVCIAGHSLGAGFGLQVGKELAKERINVKTHLFNPPSVSLAVSRGNIGEKAEYVWNRIKTVLPSSSEAHVSNDVDETYIMRLKRMIPRLSCLMDAGFGIGKWIPHLYVNSNDWISYFYVHTDGTRENMGDVESMDPTNQQNEAKLFVVSKEEQKFLEAHSLKQWWSSDGNIELRHDIRNSKLVSAQLKSLNSSIPSQVILFYYLRYISLATSHVNIRDVTDYLWSILKCVPHISGKAQISNGGEVTSGIGLMGWIPRLSGLNDTDDWVRKWVPRLSVNKNGGTKEKMVRKENMDPKDGKITATHGLQQWWPSDTKLYQALHDSKLHIRRQVRSLYTVTPWEVTKRLNPFISLPICLDSIGQKEEFVWNWNSIKSLLLSSSETHVKNDDDNKISSVPLKSCMPSLSGFKDVGFAVVRRASPMFNLPFVSPPIRHGNNVEKESFVSSSETQDSNDSDQTSIPKDATFGVGKFVPYLYANKRSGGIREKWLARRKRVICNNTGKASS